MTLGECRRLCGRNWDLNSLVIHRVINPMLTYGAVTWQTKTQQSTECIHCGSIHWSIAWYPKACFPGCHGDREKHFTAALEILVDLTPLQIYIQGEARAVTHRLVQGQPPINRWHGRDRQWLQSKIQHILGLLIDTLRPKYDIEKKFQVKLSRREDQRKVSPISLQVVWYTGALGWNRVLELASMVED